MRAVQVLFHLDPARRSPEALLAGWRSLTGSAAAAARSGVDMHVVLPADRDTTLERDAVTYHFLQATRGGRAEVASAIRVASRAWSRSMGPAWSRSIGRGWEHSTRRGAVRDGRPMRVGRSSLPRFAECIRAIEPDLLHVHGLSLPRYAAALKRATGVGTVLAQDHADRVPGPFRLLAARRLARAYDGVLFTHREQAEPFFRAGALRVGLAVHEVLESSADFTPGDVDAARAATGLHGDPCLLWLGNLTANKDPLTVLDGLSLAVPRLRDPQLWCFYREAALRERVEQRILGERALAERVHLMGVRPHALVETLLRAADLLVQGSHREGSGYAVIEALACGAMPVVTSIPSFRRIVGEAGELWTVSDPRGLAEALVAAAATEAAERRRRAREQFDRYLSWDALGRQLTEAYGAVLVAAEITP